MITVHYSKWLVIGMVKHFYRCCIYIYISIHPSHFLGWLISYKTKDPPKKAQSVFDFRGIADGRLGLSLGICEVNFILSIHHYPIGPLAIHTQME